MDQLRQKIHSLEDCIWQPQLFALLLVPLLCQSPLLTSRQLGKRRWPTVSSSYSFSWFHTTAQPLALLLMKNFLCFLVFGINFLPLHLMKLNCRILSTCPRTLSLSRSARKIYRRIQNLRQKIQQQLILVSTASREICLAKSRKKLANFFYRKFHFVLY